MKIDQVPLVDMKLCESSWKELERFMYVGFSSLLIARCKKKKMNPNGWLERRDRREWREAKNLVSRIGKAVSAV